MSAPCLWNFPELAFGCFPLPSFFILCIQVNAGKNVCLYLGAFLHRVFYTNTHRHTHSYTRVCSHNGVLVNRLHVRWWFPKMATELKTSCRLVSSWPCHHHSPTRHSRARGDAGVDRPTARPSSANAARTAMRSTLRLAMRANNCVTGVCDRLPHDASVCDLSA